MNNDQDQQENQINEEGVPLGQGLLKNKNAMAAITFTTMNFLWIFPSLGAVVMFVQMPLDRGPEGVRIEDIRIEHWLSMTIIFLQLVFFNGWLMTRKYMPKNNFKSQEGQG